MQAIQVCYWKAKPGVDHSKLPCFIYIDGEDMYGIPPAEYSDMMKVSIISYRLSLLVLADHTTTKQCTTLTYYYIYAIKVDSYFRSCQIYKLSVLKLWMAVLFLFHPI